MAKLTPFADDAASISIGGLTIENGTDRLTIYGTLELTRDKRGLADARALKALVDDAAAHLEAERNLPDAVQGPDKPKTVPNPFG